MGGTDDFSCVELWILLAATRTDGNMVGTTLSFFLNTEQK